MKGTVTKTALALILVIGGAKGQGESLWRERVKDIREQKLTPKELRSALRPLEAVTTLSYTDDEGKNIEGYKLLEVVDPVDGLHSLSYESFGPEKKLIIGFRGTTTASDRCADDLLWEPDENLPQECRKFNSSKLDYLSQAKKFTELALKRSESRDVVFTGHSLGCSLALLMNSFAIQSYENRTFTAICFAPVGIETVSARYGIQIAQSETMLALANPFDPIVKASERDQVPTLCKFKILKEPLSCKLCFQQPRSGKEMLNSFPCLLCFESVHIYKHYIEVLSNLSEVPECIF